MVSDHVGLRISTAFLSTHKKTTISRYRASRLINNRYYISKLFKVFFGRHPWHKIPFSVYHYWLNTQYTSCTWRVRNYRCNRPVNLQEIYGEYFNVLILLSSQYVINERCMRCIELNTTEGGEMFFFFFVHTLILKLYFIRLWTTLKWDVYH